MNFREEKNEKRKRNILHIRDVGSTLNSNTINRCEVAYTRYVHVMEQVRQLLDSSIYDQLEN